MKSILAAALVIASCAGLVNRGLAQSPGIVVRPAGGPYSTILNPNQNGFTSKTTAGYSVSDVGSAYSEIPYKVIPPAITEPTGDLATGPTGGFTDIVKTVDGSGFYVYYDGTNLLFRLRIGSIINGSKGYSILFDTDGKMGNSGPYADPNYVAPTSTTKGNPGFEYEVVLETNFNVSVFQVDGTASPVLVTTYPLSSNSLISVALSTDSGNPDYFYDFAIPISAIGSPSSFRVAATTVISPSSALQGNRSDIFGIDDTSYPDVSSGWQTVINAQPTINLTDIGAAGTGISPTRTAAPAINSPITGGASVAVTGTWTRMDASKPSSATITLYKNGVSVSTTAVSTGATWSITVPTIVNGDVFYAVAQATGESVSLQSASLTAGCVSVPAAPVLTCASSKGISGTLPAGATILVYQLPTTTASATSIPLTTNITYPTSTSFAFYVNGCSGGASNVTNGSYMLMASNGGCNSTPVFECITSGSSALTGLATNSTIAVTTPLYPYQNSISGTGAVSGNIVRLFINGQYVSTLTATGSAFTFSGLTLKAADQIKLYVYSGSACQTVSNPFTVSCYTQPPVITTNSSGNILSSATSVSGSSTYSGATVTLYKGVSPSGVATGSPATTAGNGSWTVSGLTLTAGETYYATLSSGGCTSSSSSAASVLSSTTVCPTITGSYSETSTSVSGTMPSSFTGTVRLYLDGVQIGSAALSASTTWTINAPFTYSLYPGGVLSVTSQATGSAENSSCSSTATISCTSPLTPIISPTSSTILTGQTVSYNVSNITANAWYALLDNSGSSYATSLYKTTTGSFNLTTNTFNTVGTFNLKLTANKLSGCPAAFQTATVQVSSPLPLILVRFGALYQNGGVLLQWSTASEQNVSHFEVQKGIDGTVFSSIGTVKAVGNSQSLNSYDLTDPQPGTGKVYYRLRMVDLDGSARYSQVVLVTISPLTISSVSPNPFTDAIYIKIQIGQARPLRIELLDAAGRQVRSMLIDGQKGSNTIQFDHLGRLANGLYLLRLRTGDQEIRQKMIRTGGQ